MSEIHTWVVVDQNDEYVSEKHDNRDEAENDANERARETGEPHAVVMFTYEFSDSELVFSTNGANIWPPKPNDPEEVEVIR